MITNLRRLLAVVALLLGLGLLAAPAGASGLDRGFVAVGTGERIGAYDNAMVLNPDGSVRITETITHIFPEGQERHGITRDIRIRAGYRDSQDVYRYYRLSDLQVTSPTGAPTDVDESELGAYLHLRIGSPDETVSGSQTYVIAYTLAHVVNEIDADRAEFVQDIVSTANEQWYDEITASVTAPAAPAGGLQFRRAGRGLDVHGDGRFAVDLLAQGSRTWPGDDGRGVAASLGFWGPEPGAHRGLDQ